MIGAIVKGSAIINNFKIATAREITSKSPIITIPDAKFWFDTTSDKSIDFEKFGNGDYVDSWLDCAPNKNTGNRINLKQDDESLQPRFIRNGLNGFPALKFDGADNMIANNVKITDIASSNSATLFVVQNYRAGNSRTFFWQINGGSIRYSIHTLWQDNNHLYFDYGLCCYSPARLYSPAPSGFVGGNRIITFIKKPSTGIIRVDGIEIGRNNAMTDTISENLQATLLVGDRYDGYIGEIIGYNRVLSDFEIKKIEKYLNRKWSFNLKL